MEKEKQYKLWLTDLKGVGGAAKRKLLWEFGSAEAIYRASEKELSRHLNEKQVTSVLKARETQDFYMAFEKLRKQGIKFTCYGDEDYPERLLSVPTPPFALYYQGHLPSDALPSVAIIGARACSEYGIFTAREFGSKLAVAGIQIISGLAMGIDGISQEAALNAGGESFGVLGSGVDVCYPKSNLFLYEKLKKQGGILSEYPPGTRPRAELFPPRNRIISGLSDIVLVVEAKEKSGTLITVDMALEQGREVFAVPGRVTDELSRGCHKLLLQGAGIAVCPEDILEALYGVENFHFNPKDTGENPDKTGEADTAGPPVLPELSGISETCELSEEEKRILSCLDIFSKTAEDIYEEIKGILTIQEIMGILVELCIRGLSEQGSEGGYRIKKSCKFKKISV